MPTSDPIRPGGVFNRCAEALGQPYYRTPRPPRTSWVQATGATRADLALPEHLSRGDEDEEDATDLSPKEREALAKAEILRIFRAHHAHLEELHPYRVRVAWRLVRFLGLLQGRLEPDQFLAEGLIPTRDSPDPWVCPLPYAANAHTRNWAVSRALFEAENLPQDERVYTVNYEEDPENPDFGHPKTVEYYLGCPLLPPNPPWKDVEQQITSENYGFPLDHYRETEDRLLLAYIEVLYQAARHLNVFAGTKTDPQMGYMGTKFLFEPQTIRSAFPNRAEIMLWEASIVDRVADRIVDHGTKNTLLWLHEHHGLTSDEARGIQMLARKVLKARMLSGDVEEDRAIMLARLDDYVRRAKANMNMRAEINGYKLQTIILGLSKAEPDDVATQFTNIVKKFDQMDAKAARSNSGTTALGPVVEFDAQGRVM